MSIINIQRDGFWINLDAKASLTWGKGEPITAEIPTCNNNNHMNIAVGVAEARSESEAKDNHVSSIGCLMSQLPGDNTPYRVKATLETKNGSRGAIIVGYADKVTTGRDDRINQASYILFDAKFDDLIMVPYNPEYVDRPLIFALGAYGKPVVGNISVQTLGITPPTMQYRIP